MRLVAVAIVLLGACGRGRHVEAEHVPARWRSVRTSVGHDVHLGQVACNECHGQRFAPPPLDVCTRCHTMTNRLHHNDATTQTPTCTQCHDFVNQAASAWDCMRCHDKAQGDVAPIGAHAGEDCAECHQQHQWPGTSARACTECHREFETEHAGLRGCRDCHSVHETKRVMLASIDPNHPPAGPSASCARCHAKQRGRLHADARALGSGHTECTSCHVAHTKQDFAARPCGECHANLPVLAASKHTCVGCHAPHDAGTAKRCESCHREPVAHPNPTKSPAGKCIGCHPPHDRMLAIASTAGSSGLGCASCHQQPSHGTAKCLDCHTPHGAKPSRDVGLCAKCHAPITKTTTGTGHARCTTCHTSNIHGAQAKPPTCAGCHAPQLATAPKGHTDCALCHQPHAPKAPANCAACHAQPAATGHGPRMACTSCHRAHGPGGRAQPPSCTTCHARPKLAGLHQTPKHGDCALCHRAHESRPADDRASCTTTCHQDRKNHEPTATRCAACHPFR